MSTGRMSDEQFERLLAAIHALGPTEEEKQSAAAQSKGSFGKCSARFAGQRDQDAVEQFIDAVETYKDMEGISDKDALKGLPLLFSGIATTWWKGVRREVHTWDDAKTMLIDHFSPTKPPYQIYVEFFKEEQEPSTALDTFVCNKRALLAKLPSGRHDEETELDFIYGLLNLKYRKNIPRHEIQSYRQLLEKGRNLERQHN